MPHTDRKRQVIIFGFFPHTSHRPWEGKRGSKPPTPLYTKYRCKYLLFALSQFSSLSFCLHSVSLLASAVILYQSRSHNFDKRGCLKVDDSLSPQWRGICLLAGHSPACLSLIPGVSKTQALPTNLFWCCSPYIDNLCTWYRRPEFARTIFY
jgi:hypothetical protein